ncbi:MAG: hypothetical protein C0456_15510 [Hyphomonas sp.]|nr:hypothetical protein [Hyphomonas sp.]
MLAWLLAGALVLPGCTSTPAKENGPIAADGTLCPGAERFDVAAIRAENAEKASDRAARISELASITPLPPGAEMAETRIRVRVPDTAMWPWDTRLTLWKDTGGTWQIATKIVRYNVPPPPPPPPPPLGEDGLPLPDWVPAPPPPPEPPYKTSALSAENAAELDQRLSDPCFRSGPDNFSYALPLAKKDEHGNKDWICPPDSAFYSAEVSIAGEPVRYLSHSCYVDFATSTFLRFAAYLIPIAPEAE